jgi:hypothetical protein
MADLGTGFKVRRFSYRSIEIIKSLRLAALRDTARMEFGGP